MWVEFEIDCLSLHNLIYNHFWKYLFLKNLCCFITKVNGNLFNPTFPKAKRLQYACGNVKIQRLLAKQNLVEHCEKY